MDEFFQNMENKTNILDTFNKRRQINWVKSSSIIKPHTLRTQNNHKMTTAHNTDEDKTTAYQDNNNKKTTPKIIDKYPREEVPVMIKKTINDKIKIIESDCIPKQRISMNVRTEDKVDVSRTKKQGERMNHIVKKHSPTSHEECKTIVKIIDSTEYNNSIEELNNKLQECSSKLIRETREKKEESYSCNGIEVNQSIGSNFHEAVRVGNAKTVEMLIKNGHVKDLDEPDWNVSGDPPLLVAATNHCLPVLSTLLSNGCDPAVRSPRGETALHRAILNGEPGSVLKFVGELLKYGCPPGVKEAGGGLTALHVLTRQLAHVQSSKNLHHDFDAALKTLDLLSNAGPVNAKDHLGRSALHILSTATNFDNNNRTEVESSIGILLKAGADPTLKNDRGETPLHESLECGALNTAALLIPHTSVGITSRYGEIPLHIAARKNYVEIVEKLLKQGEDPGVQDAGGDTPLHLASARGFHQCVSLLITSPLAQLEKVNDNGFTALQVAAESGFLNAVKLLLQAGADPSRTVTHSASNLHRHPDISTLINHELSRRQQFAA